MSDDEGEEKDIVVPKLEGKVTERKSPEGARFECWEVHQLWDNDEVTVDHIVEDEEWGASEESRKMAYRKDYPEGFFNAGYHRMTSQSGSTQEEPL